MVRLVDQHRHVLGDAVQQLPDLVLRDDAARRVIGVAQVHEPHLPVVLLRRPDHGRDVLAVIGEQRNTDRVARLQVRRILVEDLVRRDGPDDLPAVLQERAAADIEDLPRSGRDQHVVRRDVVVLRDGLHHVAVGIAVAIRVLERPGHRLDHGFRRTVGVLVVGQLGERIVLVRRPLLPGRRRRRPLGQQVERGPDANRPDRGGDATDEGPTRDCQLDRHWSPLVMCLTS